MQAKISSYTTIIGKSAESEKLSRSVTEAGRGNPQIGNYTDMALEQMDLAEFLFKNLKLKDALRIIDKALQNAENSERQDIYARCLALKGYLLAISGNSDEGFELANNAVHMGLQQNNTLATAEAYRRLAGALEYASSFQESLKAYDVAFHYCNTHQLDLQETQCLSCMSWVLLRTGDWRKCFEVCRTVLEHPGSINASKCTANGILALIPGLSARLEQGIAVLDIGCGSGRAVNMLAEAFPKSSFLGLDLCEDPILKARKEADERGNINTWFEIMDLTSFSSDSKYDLITAFDVIHDQARPDKVLKMVYETLKDGGVFLMQDIDGSSNLSENKNHPLGSMLYSISTMHCMTVSLAQGGMGLGTMWGVDTAEKMLREAGFTSIEVHRLEHDVQNAYFVVRK